MAVRQDLPTAVEPEQIRSPEIINEAALPAQHNARPPPPPPPSPQQLTVINGPDRNEFNVTVMFSNLHQASLPGAQLPGNQRTFMSLSAIIYFTLVKPFPQSEDDMLAILNRGNSYYESNMREICESFPTFFSGNELSFYTSISHIRLRNVRIFGHKTVLRTGVDVIGRGVVGRDEENVGLRSIGEVLRAFLGRRPNVAAIVICQSYSQAIMKRTSANDTTTKYYLIDSHQFDSATAFRLPLQGPLPPNDNNAAFVAFDSAESLIWVFTNLVSQIAEDFDAHEWARWNQSLQLDLTEIGAGLLC